jgi:hypothetical protein
MAVAVMTWIARVVWICLCHQSRQIPLAFCYWPFLLEYKVWRWQPLVTYLTRYSSCKGRFYCVSLLPWPQPLGNKSPTATSDGLALAWPESHGFGPALPGFGSEKSQARPKVLALAWLGLALAWAMAFNWSIYQLQFSQKNIKMLT